MGFKTDIEIAQETVMEPITEVAKTAGVDEKYLEQYGKYKAKVDYQILKDMADKPNGKLVLVTAINPTPAGEGKTTTTVGLADGMRKLGKNVMVALREPSLGPVFGVKGGAAGGGYAQVVPMEDINLHFTGDFHAIGAANNLLAAMLDNHIYQGNALNIDPRQIVWRRCVDMNDRQLRFVVDGLGGKTNGMPREDGYDITVASEVMAVLCLASDINDLKARLARLVVAYTRDGKPVTAGDLNAQGAMAALLKDALKPNLVQTLEHTPAFVHGGPFANIAHGCNSVTATKIALKLGDYAITEAGFGADLGAEKFLDIKCRMAGLKPSCVVLVATARALKYNGGVPKAETGKENLEALEKGLPNLLQHVENITTVYKLPCVVAINRFPTDTEAELKLIRDMRRRNPTLGMVELWHRLRQRGYTRCPESLFRVMRKMGLFPAEKPKNTYKPKPYEQMTYPGQRVQVDVKVVPRACVADPELRLFQYTAIDEFTRLRFLAAYPEQSTYSSADFLLKLRAWYARRGIQVECVQTDNGFEFTNRFSGSKRNLPTLFEKTAAELSIRHKLIRPYTPRHNGKVERSHREDQKRFYSCRSFYSLDDFAKQLAVHNRRSNNLPMRPLRWMSPAEVTVQYV